jgi:enoyl-[acyl-carrier-protein] reductase (NADH)
MDLLDATFDDVARRWGTLDFVVHAIGFSDKNELRGALCRHQPRQFPADDEHLLLQLHRGGEARAGDDARAARMLTLTYYGAEKVMPHYNVMGVAKAALEASVQISRDADLGPENIRVNAISAGPIKTLAASGIGDFRYILKWNEYNSPLRRNVTIEDVGGAALYLLSDLASGVTGEIHHVDAATRRRHEGRGRAGHRGLDQYSMSFNTFGRSCASPPGAKATGRRSARWSTAARRAGAQRGDIQPFLDARRPASRSSPPSGRNRIGPHPVRRVRRQDHRHARSA